VHLPTPRMPALLSVELHRDRLLGYGIVPNTTSEPLFRFPEIDSYSYECASANIASNGLQSQIQIHKAQPHEPILSPLLGSDRFDFTMCNPPFYSSREEIEKSTAEKTFSPSAICTGADAEMITPGGESAFVRQMVTESLIYKTKCRYVLVLRRLCFRGTNQCADYSWYTSMLGKLSSVADVVDSLRENVVRRRRLSLNQPV
jgi:23S rRNA A1618 N6-methylase RlmF